MTQAHCTSAAYLVIELDELNRNLVTLGLVGREYARLRPAGEHAADLPPEVVLRSASVERVEQLGRRTVSIMLTFIPWPAFYTAVSVPTLLNGSERTGE
jgi:hypothetical protein